MVLVLAVVSVVLVLFAYSCLVVASEGDRIAEEEFEKWKERKDESETTGA